MTDRMSVRDAIIILVAAALVGITVFFTTR